MKLTFALFVASSVLIVATLAEYDSYYEESTDLGAEEHTLKTYKGHPKYHHRTLRSAYYEDDTAAASDLSLDETKLKSWKKLAHVKYVPVYYYHPKKYYRGRRSAVEEEEPKLNEYEQQDDDMGADEHKLRKYYGRRYYNRYRGYYPRYYNSYYRYRPYHG